MFYVVSVWETSTDVTSMSNRNFHLNLTFSLSMHLVWLKIVLEKEKDSNSVLRETKGREVTCRFLPLYDMEKEKVEGN